MSGTIKYILLIFLMLHGCSSNNIAQKHESCPNLPNSYLLESCERFDEFYRVKKDGKYALFSQDFKQITGFIYDEMRVEWKGDDILFVRKDESVALMDTTGKLLISTAQYKDIKVINAKLRLVSKDKKHYALADKKLKSLSGFIYTEYINKFDNDTFTLSGVKYHESWSRGNCVAGGDRGLFSKDGRQLTPLIYGRFEMLTKDVFKVERETCTEMVHEMGHFYTSYILIDKSGKLLVDQKYPSDITVQEIPNNKKIILFSGPHGAMFSETGKPLIRQGKYVKLDYEGDELIFVYNTYNYESNDGIYSVYTTNGTKATMIAPPRAYGHVSILRDSNIDTNHLYAIEKNNKIGICDRHWKLIVPQLYDYIWFESNVLKVSQGNKMGAIDLSGHTIVPLGKHNITIHHHFVSVGNDGVCTAHTLYDKKGNKIAGVEKYAVLWGTYDEVRGYGKDKKVYRFDEKGNPIFERDMTTEEKQNWRKELL